MIQPHLPDGLTVETFDGTGWVGLVPFLMDEVRPPLLPALPWLSRFPETNVRTYVHGPGGRTGIWFLSLDATRMPAVLTARTTYGLPYFWSSMSVHADEERLSYRSRRRWPGPLGAGCAARVEVGPAWDQAELTPLDNYLTARFRLYSTLAGRLVAAEAEHPPWTLRRARLLELRQDLLQAAGLPEPDHAPVVHGTDAVQVRIGRWSWAA